MSCDHCPHCTADPVLRLPESHAPADPAYDSALLAAYTAAAERTRQPVRLLIRVNPWLSRSQVHDQLLRARARGAVAGVSTDQVQALLAHPLWSYMQRAGRVPSAMDVQAVGLAPTEDAARQLIDAARKVHASA